MDVFGMEIADENFYLILILVVGLLGFAYIKNKWF